MRLKHACIDAGQYGVNVSPDAYRDSGIRMLRTSDLTSNSGLAEGDGIFLDGPIPSQQMLESGDLLLSRAGTIGRAYLVPDEGSGSTFAGFLVRFRPSPSYNPRFLLYAIRSKRVQDQIVADAVTSTIQNFNADRYANLRIEQFPADEQRRIADFLDDRVARIDKIIAARTRQNILLHEQFDARRGNAVRGGRISVRRVGGWIGNLGADWEVRRLGSLATFYSGAAFPTDAQGLDTGDLPLLKVSDMRSADNLRVVTGAKNWISKNKSAEIGAGIAPAGTIIFPKVGAALLTNSRAILGIPAAFDNNVMGVRFLDAQDRFWFHVMSAIDMARLANPGPVPSVNRDAVADLRVPYPSTRERLLIGRSLDEEMSALHDQGSELLHSVSLWNEYKQSLITAAVTGGVDVTTSRSGIPG